jgi:hypothetical protein
MTFQASNSSSSGSEPVKNRKIFNFVMIYIIVIVIPGIIGSILNIVVFSKKSMRKVSTFRFLLYLSITDLLVLSVCVSDLALQDVFDIDIRRFHWIICRIQTFNIYFLTHINSTILMAISVDRAIIVTNFNIFRRKKDVKKVICLRIYSRFKNSYLGHYFSKLHHIDIVFILILLTIVMVNFHYLLFMDLNKFEYIDEQPVTPNLLNIGPKNNSSSSKLLEKGLLDFVTLKISNHTEPSDGGVMSHIPIVKDKEVYICFPPLPTKEVLFFVSFFFSFFSFNLNFFNDNRNHRCIISFSLDLDFGSTFVYFHLFLLAQCSSVRQL